ncbi:cyclin-H [Frankliniella occidentalis]|uniref:Cyclin-H n=1 Tax=Frankliniella occidentalis TaxID=133901 RepID=A0A6J1TFS1_FRAOC|nr:cyclin-H [Frankliniella occidentalis]
MFPSSTQLQHWTFKNEAEITQYREEANAKFIARHGANVPPEEIAEIFLTPSEERILVHSYESHLREFCKRFSPPMPRAVIGTAFHYFKRFYVFNSVMDYHPKEILVTCVYLAAKVEEFNVSISQFVANVKGDREKATDIILNNELLLMQRLQYHLTVHNPYRPVEGLLIDIKTRALLNDPERLRPAIDDFLDRSYLTDVCILFPPSQVALAAVLQSASSNRENLDSYVTGTLLGTPGAEKLPGLIDAVRNIRMIVKAYETVNRDIFGALNKKLEKCRNQENNPDSAIYKKRMQELLEDEDEREAVKYEKIARQQRTTEDQLVGITRVLSPSAS